MKKRTAFEYFKLLQSLLPLGRLWNRDPDSSLSEFLYGISEELARIEARSFDLFDEAIPTTMDELLSEHEEEYGLPEEGWELSETTIERRNDIRRKITTIGQHNSPYLVDLAEELDYSIEIEEYRPFIVGLSRVGDVVGVSDFPFFWKIKADIDGTFGAFGAGFFHEEFDCTHKDDIDFVLSQTRNLAWLIFNFEKIKPAHTIALYDFNNAAFNRGFSWGFNSFPHHDGLVPFKQFGPGFGDGFTNVLYTYDGTYLTGAFGRDFYLSFDSHNGAEFENTAFGDGFAKPL